MDPLVFTPYARPQIWGERRLERHLGKPLPPGTFGEAWEISAHPHHVSRVAEGPLGRQPARRTLATPRSRACRPARQAAGAVSAADQIPRLPLAAFRAGSSRRCTGRQLAAGRTRQDRSLGHPVGRTRCADLCRPSPRHHRRRPAAASGARHGRRVPSLARSPAGRLLVSAGRHRSRRRRRGADGRGSAVERRHLPAVRLEPPRARRPASRNCTSTSRLQAINWNAGPTEPGAAELRWPVCRPASAASRLSNVLISRSRDFRPSVPLPLPYAHEMSIWMVLAGEARLTGSERLCTRRFARAKPCWFRPRRRRSPGSLGYAANRSRSWPCGHTAPAKQGAAGKFAAALAVTLPISRPPTSR